MKRPRPHIPLSIRVAVAERMVSEKSDAFWQLYQSRLLVPLPYPLKDRLDALLSHLFKDEKGHLDHDPALVLRPFNESTGEYDPPANSVAHLVYRTTLEHLEKTVGRKRDSLRTVTTKGSDIWLAKKFRKLKGKPRRKQKIPSRPFPKAKRPFKHV